MKKLFTILCIFAFLGAGCLSKNEIGTSRFGRLVEGKVTESQIKGGWARPHPGPFWWGKIEKEKGIYDWSEADMVVKYWQSREQAILGTIWPFAKWDQDACHASEPTTKDPFGDEQVRMYGICHVEPFEKWVSALAERYDGDGVDDMPGLKYSITHWEIGNEPDLQADDFKFFQSGPYAYQEIFRLAHDVIKTTSQDSVVLFGGMSGIRSSSVDYWRKILFMDRSRGDIGNIHSISENDAFFAKEYRNFLNGLGLEQKTFWITEALVGSQEETWDEDKAAQMTFIGYVEAFANGADKIFNVGKHDPTGGPGEKSEQVFDLLVKTIDEFDSVERLSDTSVEFYIGKRAIYALWGNAMLPSDVKGKVDVLLYDGTKEKTDAKDVLAEKPLFVIK